MDITTTDRALAARIASAAGDLGGISTTECAATRRALDAMHRESDEHRAAVEQLRGEFLRAAAECQADKFALFAPRVRDWKNGGTRPQTVGEIVHEEMQYRDFADRAMEVLLKAAAGQGTHREAQQLLDEMAAHWAENEVVL